jgi:hypothetical protein
MKALQKQGFRSLYGRQTLGRGPILAQTGLSRRTSRGAVEQAALTLAAEASQPLAGGALADAGRRGGVAERPAVAFNPVDEQLAAARAQVLASGRSFIRSSSGAGLRGSSSVQRGPGEQPT